MLVAPAHMRRKELALRKRGYVDTTEFFSHIYKWVKTATTLTLANASMPFNQVTY